MIGKQGIEQTRPELSTHDTALAALQTDLGDPSARTNLQTILAMLGNPDAAGKSLYDNLGDFKGRTNDQDLLQVLGVPDVSGKDLHTLLVTDRLDHGTYGLSATETEVAAIQTDLDNVTDGLGALKALIDAVPTAIEIQTEMEADGASLLDTIRDDLANATDGLGALKTLIDAIPTTMVGTDNAALATVLEDAMQKSTAPAYNQDTDSLEALRELLDTIAGYLTTEIADILTDTGTTLPGLLSTIQTDLDNPSQYMANLTTLETRLSALRAGYLDELAAGNLPTDVANVKTVADGIQTDLSNVTDGLGALKTLLDAIPTTMVGTNNAALASAWTAALATALGNYTATRAGNLDQLDFALQEAIAAIPTTMVGTNSAFLANVGGLLNTAAATGAVDSSTLVMGYVKQLVTNSRRVVHRMVFWSEIDDLITIDATAGDETLPPVTVAEIPTGAVILRVNVILSIGSFEDTSGSENKVVLAGTEHIQIDKTGGTYIDAIKMIAGMWLTGANAVRGGLLMIGNIDVASEVDVNDTYELKIEGADVTAASLLLRDVQTGLIVYFTLE